jgi:predicted phosphoribosyltransferase
VLAVPVCAPGSHRAVASVVDDLVCLESPPGFRAVGQFYADFGQTSDEEVTALLALADERPAGEMPDWPT